MFLRTRGTGASPANSQATLMNLRGHRLTNCPPPNGMYFALQLRSSEKGVVIEPALGRALHYTHFSIGVQDSVIASHQRLYREGGDAAETLVQLEEARKRVWKEIWNAYDIAYDEVELLPVSYETTNRALKLLAAVGDDVSSVAQCPESFTLLTMRRDSCTPVVCTHYFAESARSASLQVEGHTTRTSAPHELTASASAMVSPVVVIDLSHIPAAEAATKVAVELAWVVAFATTAADNVVMRACAIVVRLPYDVMPTVSQLVHVTSALARVSDSGSTYAHAVLEAMDFLGEHLALVHRAFALDDSPPAPVHFVGLSEAELVSSVRALLGGVEEAHRREVVVLAGDHHLLDTPESRGYLQRWEGAWSAPTRLLSVPLKALLEGGSESWDEYSRKEQERSNFCPCCSSCS